MVTDALGVQQWGTSPFDPALEAPLPHPGGSQDGLVVGLAGHHLAADLVPVQELGLEVAVIVDLAGVDQVGDPGRR